MILFNKIYVTLFDETLPENYDFPSDWIVPWLENRRFGKSVGLWAKIENTL